MEIIPYIVPSVLLGIPLGHYLIRWMNPESFRRICMAFDALIVAFGLSRVLIELDLATALTTYSILTIVMMLNAYLLFRFFRDRTVTLGRKETRCRLVRPSSYGIMSGQPSA